MLADLDERFRQAVQAFWDARDRQQQKQVAAGKIDAGTRGAVTGGAQMGALEVLLTDVLLDAGLSPYHIRARTALSLPGYYRSEKRWDLLVVADGQLLLAVEFKSQVGPSFGNNFNNRTEEAIGNAEDIWTAYREGRFGHHPPPFLGYFFLLEDCPRVHAPVTNAEPYFKVDPVFEGASYVKRYQVLCERLVLERKYNAACLTVATKSSPTAVSFPADQLNFRGFAAAAEAHARAFINARRLPKPSQALTWLGLAAALNGTGVLFSGVLLEAPQLLQFGVQLGAANHVVSGEQFLPGVVHDLGPEVRGGPVPYLQLPVNVCALLVHLDDNVC